jgi:PAS domain S-box-containing protein
LVQPDGLKFLRGAAPSLPSEYTQFFDGAVIDAICGPCSLAVTKKIQVIASDVHSDSRWKASAWPELMSKIGMRGCWCTPILSADQKVQGVLVIYQREPRHPAPIQQEFIQQVAHIASIAIERAQRETALRRNEAFLKEAQRLSSTGGFSWSVATNEITWSDEVYRIFGIEPGGPLTPETTDLRVHPDDLPFIYEKVNRARVDGKDFDFDYRLMMPDGSTKYLHTVFHRTQDSEGAVEFVGAIQDVTERRRSEDALGELRTELAHVARVTTLGALTASIAHEVNQPLSGIMTNASTCLRMLAADPPNINGARETARRTIRDANRASEVITRLRALFTKKGASSERVDMNEAAQEVIALSLNELQRKGVTVRAELAADLPPVTGDRVQLQQVILNLILNASDAMSSVEGRPRLLIVKTEYDHERGVLVAVRDTGIGFDPEHAGRLFEAFYTTKSGGMGIGLSVSRSIVESHHGRLWTEANEGAGATFLFSIPRRADEGDDGSPLVPSYAAPDEILEAAVTVSTR